ncbi:MAG: efflux RND transporter permease subunit, partial [Lentisphaeraceae bacterium]|nr:efflux RND transporter permease subunit [Lentisphaeraceae bacterium]
MNIIRLAIRQPITVAVAVLFIFLAGVVALQNFAVQMTPEVDDAIIAVTTTWENASPQEIESEVVDPQEEKLQGLSNLRSISSTSSLGRGQIRLEFNNGVDKDAALRQVSDKLREVKSYPQNVDEPVIEATDPESKDYIAWYVLSTVDESFDIQTLYDFANDRLKPQLERVPGISEVNVLGGREREVQVRFDAAKLAHYGLTLSELPTRLRSANTNFSGGALQQGKLDIRVRSVGRFSTAQQVLNFVIRQNDDGPVAIRDVAEVIETYKERRSFVRVNGVASLAINFQREPGSNVIEIMGDLRRTISELNEPGSLLDSQSKKLGLKSPLELNISYDGTTYIHSALELVKNNIYVGGLLAIVVLLLFLRSVRSVGIIALAIPVSMIGTVVIMVLLGRSVNIISLAGMAFAIGMVVDNSIVVLENIYRHLEMGKKRFDAAYEGTREVAGAVLASTLTTLVVFLPILLIEDQVGQLFRDIALAIMASVGVSYIVSITLIPSFAALLLKARVKKQCDTKKDPLLQRFTYAINGNVFIRLSVVALFVTITCVGIVKLVPELDYLPKGNRNITFGMMLPPPGYNVDQMNKMGKRVEETMRPFWQENAERPHVPVPYSPTGATVQPPPLEDYFLVQTGSMLFHGAISSDARRASDNEALLQHASRADVLPGVFAFAFQFPLFNIGGTSGSAVKINLTGNDLDQVANSAGALFGTLMQKFGPGTVRPTPANFNLKTPELQLIPKHGKLSESGLSNTELGLAVQANGDGLFLGEYSQRGDLVDFKLINKNSVNKKFISSIAQTQLATPSGDIVALDKLADFKWVESAEEIRRINRQRAVTLEFTAPKGMPLEQAI